MALGAIIAAAVVLLLPDRYPEVNFTSSLGDPVVVSMNLDPKTSVDAAFVALAGGHAYLAMADNQNLTVQDRDLAAGKQHWLKDVTAPNNPSSVTWQWLAVAGDTLLIAAQLYGTTDSRALFAVRTGDGDEPWDEPLPDGVSVHVFGSAAVTVDTKNHTVSGLDVQSGKPSWHLDAPKDQYGGQDVAVYGVTTDPDLAGPAGFDGDPGTTVDTRFVMVGADHSARVVDASNGKVLAIQPNVGAPDGDYLAYRDRLYAAGTDAGYSVVSYALNDLKDSKLVYKSGDSNRRLSTPDTSGIGQPIRPCGDRICVLDQNSYDDKTTQLHVVDPGTAKLLWSRDVPNAQQVTPVGDRILVTGGSSPTVNELVDPDGKVLVNDKGDNAAWVRLNAASVLLFADAPSSSTTDEPISGLGTHSLKRTSLGVLRNVRTASCAWTDSLIVCGRETDFGIWKLT